MRHKYVSIIVLSALPVWLLGQDSSKPNSLPTPHGTGRLFITPAPGQIPTSLKDLCAASSLIVHARIVKTLLARETSPGSLETDAIVSVVATLHGAADIHELMIAQRGGVLSNHSVIPTQYALVQTGDEYLLFLTEDLRPKTPIIGGLKRYLITGIWSGLLHVRNGRVVVETESADPLRSQFQGMTKEKVMDEIAASL